MVRSRADLFLGGLPLEVDTGQSWQLCKTLQLIVLNSREIQRERKRERLIQRLFCLLLHSPHARNGQLLGARNSVWLPHVVAGFQGLEPALMPPRVCSKLEVGVGGEVRAVIQAH